SSPRNLRQIFEDDGRALEQESSSLRYQPGGSKKSHSIKKPGIPRIPLDQGDPPPTWNTVIAKVVHAYQSSQNLGRVGLALSILGELEASKLIVYKSKHQVLTTLQLTPPDPQGKVILRESYLQFYDAEKRFWSLRFEKPGDEQEFVGSMAKHKLPVEHFHNEVSSSGEDLSTKRSRENQPVNPPQPQPRSRLAMPSLEKLEDEDVEQRSPPSEDVIVTPLPRPIGSSNEQGKSLVVATKQAEEPPPLAVKTLDKYLDEQRTAGAMMEHKMDAILQAMQRMGKSVPPTQVPEDPQLERDSEDEMLELEQKLLNLKRENRALKRNLKAREQALEDLRCSACSLCEELLTQNGELRDQNVSQEGHSTCHNCELSAKQIAKMQRHIAALQEALRIFQKAGDASTGRL
ncbi:hypothetical protein KR084_006448, partial [Drosophila pseudotakahashii]